ncbi:uncharacterized protein TRIADDRAFT_53649 [Trichoplax adhaerens]|uniref:V-type ATPase assembly factor PKR1 n=1 Tax=Trichoplax adhaerens TaxID=10228 RepID=B3RPS9_TRIAD|nr:hypothetical protein TRIADDRAFT_53649 [Trichoplax adhaerens]EDV28237.1 hypothetical protein TRIADDRAFT_53649 [Trichoplax adhaerens]|eukprot:XP_002110071.1 hypothetical protein TRIADDRAFT_53649 [Trichoplax adhaerens]
MAKSNNDTDAALSSDNSGFFGPIVDNIFQPGVNSQVVIFINVVFVILLILFITLAVLWELNIHLIILGSLTFILIISINWFLAEIQKVKMESAQEHNEEDHNKKD